MAGRPLHTSKAPDAAIVLPLLGLFLLMPPVIGLFASARMVFGIPLIVLYVFGVWAALILCALFLARHLSPLTGPGQPDQAAPATDAGPQG
jgi:hypothetical protein